ncbi:DUF2787 family protein [Paraglaciecola sp. Hal342]
MRLVSIIPQNFNNDAITINFRDPTYSPESRGLFTPVEVGLEKRDNAWLFLTAASQTLPM